MATRTSPGDPRWAQLQRWIDDYRASLAESIAADPREQRNTENYASFRDGETSALDDLQEWLSRASRRASKRAQRKS